MMKKSDKIWLSIAGVLILSGMILAGAAYKVMGGEVEQLATDTNVKNSYEIEKAISKIEINTEVSKIVIGLSEDDVCHIEVVEWSKYRHMVNYENGVLTIDTKDTRKWYEHIGFSIGEMSVRIRIPKENMAELKIQSDSGAVQIGELKGDAVNVSTATGSVTLANMNVEDIEIRSETGSVNLTDVKAKDMELRSETGHLTLTDGKAKDIEVRTETGKIVLGNVVVERAADIQSETGAVLFEGFDAATIGVKTSTGKVSGYLYSGKVFDVKSSTGKISVPADEQGGKCEIRTSTGKVEITVGEAK